MGCLFEAFCGFEFFRLLGKHHVFVLSFHARLSGTSFEWPFILNLFSFEPVHIHARSLVVVHIHARSIDNWDYTEPFNV